MLRRSDSEWLPDDFAHELTLVLELEGGRLAVFSSCSHAGLPTIAAEVAKAFPSQRVAFYVGGLHLVHATDDEVLAVAETVRRAGIERLCIGHCTGPRACDLLAGALPTRVTELHTGMELCLS